MVKIQWEFSPKCAILPIIANDKAKVLERLKENTGVQISAREHQGIEELGINMIGAQVKKESDKSSENQAAKAKKNYLHDYNAHEIKEHFLSAIKSSIKLDAKDIDVALNWALENKSEKIRFGQKKIYEICWHGEAGYIKNYKTGEYFDWGLNSIKEGRKVAEISKEEAARRQIENQKAKEEQEKQKVEEEKNVATKAKKYFEGFFKASLINTTQNKYLQRKGIIPFPISNLIYC